MTAYRFCRTDDMPLLVEAYEHCRGPEDAGEPSLDRAGFKALVREADLWCSSCMVALEGREPVAVLLGAKRDEATLVHALRVHPAHRRRGHGRHLLTSLGQKLAILGPPRLVAEVPTEREPAQALFAACRWRSGPRFVDWRRDRATGAQRPAAGASSELPVSPLEPAEATASGLLRTAPRSWRRELPALERQGDELLGLGFHSPDRLEACLLAAAAAPRGWEIRAVGLTDSELGRLGLGLLLDELERRGDGDPLLLSRVAPEEVGPELLVALGFRRGCEFLQFATEAKAA